ncbi:MAG: nitrophenyl compound nitroreductase subunit ArsF family protein [Thermoguttaceae bacterium]|nr:nitrophenyl compound nitroreductase subunit ArsF family protein [Thermoguttaceae bacterium]
MRSRSIFRLAFAAGAFSLLAVALPAVPSSPAHGADAPAHQVILCYFHRTVRCPTCKMVGSYVQEAVQAGFPAQMKDGTVKLLMVDFQDPRNQPYVKAYRVTGPLLVVLDVRDGKVAAWKPVPKVWSLLSKKTEFFKCVQSEVQGYLDAQEAAGR